jgi:hypothetical protein
LICGVVICCAATALPRIFIFNAAPAIRGIVFGHAAMATARNRVMVMAMIVALEEEGDGGGDKEGNGERQQ